MLHKELAGSVHRRLDDLVRIACDGDDHAVTELARSEVPYLVQTVRTLMSQHQPGDLGTCRACSRILLRWQRLLYRPKAPCRVYLAARSALFHESHGTHHAAR